MIFSHIFVQTIVQPFVLISALASYLRRSVGPMTSPVCKHWIFQESEKEAGHSGFESVIKPGIPHVGSASLTQERH